MGLKRKQKQTSTETQIGSAAFVLEQSEKVEH